MAKLGGCRSHTLSVGQNGSDRFSEGVWGDPFEANRLPGFTPLFAEPVGVADGQGAVGEDQIKFILSDWIGPAPAEHLYSKRR